MKYLIYSLLALVISGCASGPQTVAQPSCGKPSMLGAEVVCPGQQMPFIHASRTNADQRVTD